MARGRMAYPEDALDRLAASKTNVIALDAFGAAASLGDARTVNSFMIGALSKLLPLPVEVWKEALAARFKRGLELNLRAFDMGREAVQLPGGLAAGSSPQPAGVS
jgi:indolepyruvate ferredoxin oxidoreductase beta subunit